MCCGVLKEYLYSCFYYQFRRYARHLRNWLFYQWFRYGRQRECLVILRQRIKDRQYEDIQIIDKHLSNPVLYGNGNESTKAWKPVG